MKKNLFLKILLMMLVAILALSVVACGPKKPLVDDGPDTPPEEEELHLATTADIVTILNGLKPLLAEIESVEDEIHIDVSLDIAIADTNYKLAIQGNIYADEYDDNEVLLELKNFKKGENDKTLLGLYLKKNVLYLQQEVTASEPKVKFSNLDALELSQMLSKLPGMLSRQEIDLQKGIDKVIGAIGEGVVPSLIDALLQETEALKFFDEEDSYKLEVVSDKLGGAVNDILDTFKKEISDYMDIIDFISSIMFGVETDGLSKAEKFPEVSIKANKNKSGDVNGLSIYYKSIEDLIVNIDVNANVSASKDFDVSFPKLTQFEEGVLKVSLNVGLGAKGLSLQGDVLVDPSFKVGEDNPRAYASDFKLCMGEESYDIKAEYNGKTLFFDIGTLYDAFNLERPLNTIYGINFDIMSKLGKAPVGTPDNSSGEGNENESNANPTFAVTIAEDWFSSVFGQLDMFTDLIKGAVSGNGLNLDVNTILEPLFSGLLVKTDTDGKATKIPYTQIDLIKDLNIVLAQFAEDYDEEKEYTEEELSLLSASVISAFAGLELSVEDIINAEEGLQIGLNKIADALGLELNISFGEIEILSLSLELDIVKRSLFNYPEDNYFANKPYIQLDYVDRDGATGDNDFALPNVVFDTVGEGEEAQTKRVNIILKELLYILDAYKEFATE